MNLLNNDNNADLDGILGEFENDMTSPSIHMNTDNPPEGNIKDKFLVFHYNINSILVDGRLDLLTDIVVKYKVHVLVLTESKLDASIPDNVIKIPGFHEPVRKDRNRHGGGVVVYIADFLPFKQKSDLELNLLEHIWVDIFISGQTFSINAIYRPPNETNEDHIKFIDNTKILLENLSNYNNNTGVLLGDLNFGNIYCKEPILEPKPLDNDASDLFAENGFTQVIDIPTRISQQSISLIDLIYVDNTENVLTNGTVNGLTDHLGTFVYFNTNCKIPTCRTTTVF